MSAHSFEPSEPLPRHGLGTRLSVPELEPDSIFFADQPRVEIDARVELERLRPLLQDYNPLDSSNHVDARPAHGVAVFKILAYLLLAAVPILIGIAVLGSLTITC